MLWYPPKQQGDLDGACGFYSVANAITVVTGRPISPDSFRILVSCHSQTNRSMLPWDILDGVDRMELNSILSNYISLLPDKNSIGISRPFWNKKPTLDQFWTAVWEHLACPRAAVITAFHQDQADVVIRSHWTVIDRATDKTFRLYDSSGSQRILRKFSRVERRNKDKHVPNTLRPYAFEGTSTFFIKKM